VFTDRDGDPSGWAGHCHWLPRPALPLSLRARITRSYAVLFMRGVVTVHFP